MSIKLINAPALVLINPLIAGSAPSMFTQERRWHTLVRTECLLPVALLVLAFILKLLIDRTATLATLIQSVVELPVDIAFLATSFVAAFAISDPKNVLIGMTSFIAFIIGTIFVVFMWRRSIWSFERNYLGWTISLGIINYSLSIFGVVLSINLLIGGRP